MARGDDKTKRDPDTSAGRTVTRLLFRNRVLGLVLAVAFAGVLVLLPLWLAGAMGVPLD